MGRISIATNTGWVFNTHFLLYFIHNCVVLRTNKRYCAQRAHSDTARESRYIIQRSIRESWIVVKFVTLILINSIAHMRQRCFHINFIYDVTRKTWYLYLFSLTPSIHHAHTSHITTTLAALEAHLSQQPHFPRKLINHDGRTITG